MTRTIALAGALLLAGLAAPATASPLWSGCYIGGNGAYGWQSVALVNTKEDPPLNMGSHIATGGAGGVQGGCDLQPGNVVLGVAGSFDWMAISGDHIGNPGEDPYRERSHASSLATLTARAGYLWQPNLLVYAKGGAAWLNGTLDELYLNDSSAVLQIAPASVAGWTVGAGAEFRFAPQWSAFAEYDYAGFGTRPARYTDGNSWYDYDATQSVAWAVVGINYRLAGP